jgi:hypothetical protein
LKPDGIDGIDGILDGIGADITSIPSGDAMLTDIKARAARAKQKPYKLTDRDGLYLHVSTSGAKSWRFDYRLLGARQTLTIGQYPEVSLSVARDRLADARRKVAEGVSPAEAKQEAKAQAKMGRKNTVQALGEEWYKVRSASQSASWADNAKRFLEQDIYPALASSITASFPLVATSRAGLPAFRARGSFL